MTLHPEPSTRCATAPQRAPRVPDASAPEPIAFASTRGRLVLLATVLASGMAFLDGTVVNVALPRMGSDLNVGFTTLQWVLDAYLLTLGSLVLVGGSLGDLLGRRRVFELGVAGFAVASLLCGAAPSGATLVAARAAQGIFAALLVPGSLAILTSTFPAHDRGAAIGTWSGLAGVSTAIGPFIGGWLVDASSWRWVFLLNVPLAAAALVASRRGIPDLPGSRRPGHLLRQVDLPGAALAVVGLGLLVLPLIEYTRLGIAAALVLGAAGLAILAVFVLLERRRPQPMLPVSLFRIRGFTMANLVTFVVYGALGGALFLLTVTVQRSLGYSALAAGAATLPFTVLMLFLSPRVGGMLPSVGARPLLVAGTLLDAAGLALLIRVEPGASYVSGVLPGVLVFALGMSLVVAPVTTLALDAVDDAHSGLASGVNNAVARIASLMAVAVLPLAGGLTAETVSSQEFVDGFHRALLVATGLCLVGAVASAVGLRRDDGRPDAQTA